MVLDHAVAISKSAQSLGDAARFPVGPRPSPDGEKKFWNPLEALL